MEDGRIPLPEAEIAARLIVPGWAHMHSGIEIRGRIFLAVYLFLLSVGMLYWGTALGAMLLGLAFSVHASSVLDILIRQGNVRFPSMMATAMLVSLVLAVGVYGPLGWTLSHVASPIEYDADAPPFARLDVVLVNRWAFRWNGPRPGDVVLFRPILEQNVGNPINLVHVRFLIRETQIIDRVLGRAGDRVVWDGRRLTVNGKAVSWRPLIPEKLPEHLDITVPSGHVLILPTSALSAIRGAPEAYWKVAGLIPLGNIEGGAFLRNNPPSRLWFIR